MKRILAIALVLITAVSLSACGKTENVKNFEALVDKIDTVTLRSQRAIVDAEAAYGRLTEEEKEQTKKETVLYEAKEQLTVLQIEEKIEVINQVLADFNEVTFDSGEDIFEIITMVNDIPLEHRHKIADISKLDRLQQMYKTQVLGKVQITADLITSIGKVTLDSKDAIEAARESYNGLKPSLRAMVGNYSDLVSAENKYLKLYRNYARGLAREYYSKFDHIARIDTANDSTAYHKQMPGLDSQRSYMLPYVVINYELFNLCIRYYTPDIPADWENVTLVVDQKEYNTNFDPSGVTENDFGTALYYDHILTTNANMEHEEIQMLRAVADSNETTIIFEGKGGREKITVSEEDKKIISDTLAYYEGEVNKHIGLNN